MIQRRIKTFLRTVVPLLLFSATLALTGCGPADEQELYDAAMSAQRTEKYDEAIGWYESLLAEYPRTPRKPEVLYALGVLYQDRSKNFTKALEMYRKIVSEFPDHATASNAMFMVGFIEHNEMKNLDAARSAYEAFITKYPDSPLIESARFELANLGKDPAELFSAQNESNRPR